MCRLQKLELLLSPLELTSELLQEFVPIDCHKLSTKFNGLLFQRRKLGYINLKTIRFRCFNFKHFFFRLLRLVVLKYKVANFILFRVILECKLLVIVRTVRILKVSQELILRVSSHVGLYHVHKLFSVGCNFDNEYIYYLFDIRRGNKDLGLHYKLIMKL